MQTNEELEERRAAASALEEKARAALPAQNAGVGAAGGTQRSDAARCPPHGTASAQRCPSSRGHPSLQTEPELRH